ncbi:hypothetical protein HYALB_00004588, partial [Hymenoscyphus albidus]
MRFSFSFSLAAASLPLSLCATIYVSPTGSDSGTGTITAPLKSIQSAINLATAGSTIYLRAGTYGLTTNIQFTKSGTASAPYTISAYESEKVIIDGEALPSTPGELDSSIPSKNRGIFHIEKAHYWNFIGLELINGPYGIYHADSSNNYYERVVTRDNYETGFQMQGASAQNTILYLDSYGNRDPRKNGESADGFACKEGSGEGNILRGARLWNNVDDGLDLWEFKSGVTIEDTLSWGNGVNRWGFSEFEGDGNGFKLGGGNKGDIGPANHIITNCVAFENAAGGFVDNSQTGAFTLTGNTAYNNTKTGFSFKTATATLKQNIAVANAQADESLSSAQKDSRNSWNSGTWSASSFKSLDKTTAIGARDPSGKIVGSDFLVPASGADMGASTY